MIVKEDNLIDEPIFLYLTEKESNVFSSPSVIPIIENKDNKFLLEHEYIKHISDNKGISLIESYNKILESNNIKYNNTKVIINDYDVILDPSICNIYENYIIRPISKYNPIYKILESFTMHDSVKLNKKFIKDYNYEELKNEYEKTKNIIDRSNQYISNYNIDSRSETPEPSEFSKYLRNELTKSVKKLKELKKRI